MYLPIKQSSQVLKNLLMTALLTLTTSIGIVNAANPVPVLVSDIATSPTIEHSNPSHFTQVGDRVFFFAETRQSGKELWVTDSAGSRLVKDIWPGSEASFRDTLRHTEGIIEFNNELYFTANDGVHGFELWKSDGTQSGTMLVKDLNPGAFGSIIREFEVAGGNLFFTSNNDLWVSHGTSASTVRIAGLISVHDLTKVGDIVYFRGRNPFGTVIDVELWKSDGTVAGTGLVKDINPSGSSSPRMLTTVGDTLFFYADDGTSGLELWKSDGTEVGTVFVKDINPLGSSSFVSGNLGDRFVEYEAKLYFFADDGVHGRELWKSDGTANGTVIVRDIFPDNGDVADHISNLIVFDGNLYFSANDGLHGTELWRSDGTEAGTYILKDILTGANNGHPRNSSPTLFVVAGNSLYFAAESLGREIMKTDGTTQGTVLIKDIAPQSARSQPSYLTAVGDTVYFNMDDSVHGKEPWRTDGTESGTELVNDIGTGEHSDPSVYVEVNGIAYFTASSRSGDRELWATDGETSWLVKDIYVGPTGSNPIYLTAVNNMLMFWADNGLNGMELWSSDGTASGTQMVKDITPGSRNSLPQHLTAFKGMVLFRAFNPEFGFELWKSDGTEAGTEIILDINPGSSSSGFSELILVNDKVFFRAYDGVNGYEMWVTDGSKAGTYRITDIDGGTTLGSVNEIINVNSTLYFSGFDGSSYGVWKLDRTGLSITKISSGRGSLALAGKNILLVRFTELWAIGDGLGGEVLLGDYSSLPKVVSTDKLAFYSVTTDTYGKELWVTDGTVAGTYMVKDINPGPAGSLINNMKAVGDKLYFSASDGVTGEELWVSDGTEAGTMLVADLSPGASSLPVPLGELDGSLFFSADNGVTGQELWRLREPPVVVGSGVMGDYIWEDTNGDGIQNNNESGLANVTVQLLTCMREVLDSTTSDVNGYYAFNKLLPGQYMMRFLLPGGYTFSPERNAGDYRLDSNVNQSTGLSQCYTMNDGQQRLAIDAGIMPASEPVGNGVMGDYIWSDSNGDGVQGDSEPGLANVTVQLLSCDKTVIDTTISGANGQYAFNHLLPGKYMMRFLLPVGHAFSPEKQGGNYRLDSNVNAVTGLSQCYAMSKNKKRNAIDVGMVPTDNTVADNITVSKAIYYSSSNRLWIRAESDAQPDGAATLTATMIVNGVETVLGTVGWKADKGFYQQAFRNVTEAPDSVILTSDHGGGVAESVQVR